jgi:hypothetical protein
VSTSNDLKKSAGLGASKMSDTPRTGPDEGPGKKFYLVVDGQRKGPFAPEALPEHGLEHDTLIWHTGMSEWTSADQVPALHELLLTIPPPLPRERQVESTPDTFRSLYRWWLTLLGTATLLLLLGSLFLWTGVVGCNHVADYRRYSEYLGLFQALVALGGLSVAGGVLSLFVSVAFFSAFLYKLWDLIQDGHARTSPGLAVGLMFVPFLNLYWVFVAVPGLAVDLGKYLRRHGLNEEPPPSVGLAVAFGLLFLGNHIPYLQFLLFLPMLVVMVLLLAGWKNTALAILLAQRRGKFAPALADSGRRSIRPSPPFDEARTAITDRQSGQQLP